MTPVSFSLHVDFAVDSRQVWDELVDWKAHEAWVPATRAEVDGDDPTAIGATFTAWTGFGRLALEDRMKVVECAWIDETASGTCEVEKLGPVLGGGARFTVAPRGSGARVDWFEDVTVPRLPRFLAPVAAQIGALGFKLGMRRLARVLERRAHAA